MWNRWAASPSVRDGVERRFGVTPSREARWAAGPQMGSRKQVPGPALVSAPLVDTHPREGGGPLVPTTAERTALKSRWHFRVGSTHDAFSSRLHNNGRRETRERHTRICTASRSSTLLHQSCALQQSHPGHSSEESLPMSLVDLQDSPTATHGNPGVDRSLCPAATDAQMIRPSGGALERPALTEYMPRTFFFARCYANRRCQSVLSSPAEDALRAPLVARRPAAR